MTRTINAVAVDDYERTALRGTHIPHPAADGYGLPAIDAATGKPLLLCVTCTEEADTVYWPCPTIRLLDFYEARADVTPTRRAA